MLDVADLLRIIEELRAEVASLRAENERLRADNAALRAENEHLKELLAKNSQNSSLPPSFDRKKAKKGKTPSGKSRGGQVGHRGTSRALFPPERVTTVVSCQQAPVCDCGTVMTVQPSYNRHQVVDLPTEIPYVVTEYRRHQCTCVTCGGRTWAPLPAGVPRGAFGPQLVSLMSILATQYRMSRRQVRTFVSEVLGIPISLGSVSTQEGHVTAALAASHAEAVTVASQAPVKYVDETRYRQSGTPGYAWVLVTFEQVLFFLRPSRGSRIAREVIGTCGTVVTDRYAGYAWVDETKRQVCWAHLLRDFTQIAERQGRAGDYGRSLVHLTELLFAEWWQWKSLGPPDGKQSLALSCAALRAKIDATLVAASTCGHLRTERTCTKILALNEALWTFLEVPDVEPTNNAAERALRPLVIHRKLSFGTQSVRGTQFIERLFSLILTAPVQHYNPLQKVREALSSWWAVTPAPA